MSSVWAGVVCRVALWARPSAEMSVTCTGISAGALTAGGVPRSPGPILNVAGMRAPEARGGVGFARCVVAGGWVTVAGRVPVAVE